MYILPFSASGIATAVWNRTTRALTSILSSGVFEQTVKNASVPASTIYDTIPASGQLWNGYIITNSGAAGQSSFGLYDGTTYVPGTSVGAGSSSGHMAMGWRELRPAIRNNDAVNASTVSFSAINVI